MEVKLTMTNLNTHHLWFAFPFSSPDIENRSIVFFVGYLCTLPILWIQMMDENSARNENCLFRNRLFIELTLCTNVYRFQRFRFLRGKITKSFCLVTSNWNEIHADRFYLYLCQNGFFFALCLFWFMVWNLECKLQTTDETRMQRSQKWLWTAIFFWPLNVFRFVP